MYPLMERRQELLVLLQKTLASLPTATEARLETPPAGLGDYAFPCFPLAPLLKRSPQDIATTIASRFPPQPWLAAVDAKGGYVNFTIDPLFLAQETLRLILQHKGAYGTLPAQGKTVIIEHTSANPNGPLHVGRARNPIIGDTLVRIFKAAGFSVRSQFYLDDLGKQVAILAWGVANIPRDQIPAPEIQKADHQHVGFYQAAHERMEQDATVSEQIAEIIQKLEHGEQATVQQVHAAYEPVLAGIRQSLHRINIDIDSYVPESTFVLDSSVQRVVEGLKATEHCREEDGAFYLDLSAFGIHGRNTKFFFLRRDGTTLYATRDIAYHEWKATQADLLVNVLGEDHKLESRQVEIALRLLHAPTIPQAVFYAFVSLPGGKMSTRRGRVVYLDDLIDECVERAYEEVRKRRGQELTEVQMRAIAESVGIGSLRYNIIKVQPEKDIVFKWEEALNFEGNAVPFIQYSHARACSILAKAPNAAASFDASLLTHPAECALIAQLARLPLSVEEAYRSHRPNLMATYLYDTAAAFNQFYRDCPVLVEADEALKASRLALVAASRIVLANALGMLGIAAPEEM